MHLTASQNRTCPTCRVYIENDGIRNTMAEQVAKKLSGLNDVDLEEKMKASPENVLKEHKKLLNTMTRSLEIERNNIWSEMKSESKKLMQEFEDNRVMKLAALENVKMTYEKKLKDLMKQREKIIKDSKAIFEKKRVALENTFKQKIQELQDELMATQMMEEQNGSTGNFKKMKKEEDSLKKTLKITKTFHQKVHIGFVITFICICIILGVVLNITTTYGSTNNNNNIETTKTIINVAYNTRHCIPSHHYDVVVLH